MDHSSMGESPFRGRGPAMPGYGWRVLHRVDNPRAASDALYSDEYSWRCPRAAPSRKMRRGSKSRRSASEARIHRSVHRVNPATPAEKQYVHTKPDSYRPR